MQKHTIRTRRLREHLIERQHAIQHDLARRVRSGRSDTPAEGRDDLEHSEADTQGDLQRALLQMQAETLSRIDAALTRIDEGGYGRCAECEEDIAERRLIALPFAIRCQSCEEDRERGQKVAKALAAVRVGPSLSSEFVRS